MEKDEFEKGYADRSGVTVEWLHEQGQGAIPCDCGEKGCNGWAMVNLLDNVCEYCGLSDDVLFRVNPFAAEVYDDHTGHWICDGCYDSWMDDL